MGPACAPSGSAPGWCVVALERGRWYAPPCPLKLAVAGLWLAILETCPPGEGMVWLDLMRWCTVLGNDHRPRRGSGADRIEDPQLWRDVGSRKPRAGAFLSHVTVRC
jgi:hypothetical protein